jgi:hypothetical protein
MSLNDIKRLVLVTETQCIICETETGFINIILMNEYLKLMVNKIHQEVETKYNFEDSYLQDYNSM